MIKILSFLIIINLVKAQNFTETKILAPDGIADDSFGIVEIKFPYLFVGAVGVGAGTLDTRGALYFYKFEDENWSFKQKIIGPSNTSALFGRSLSVKDSFLFVGAMLDTVNNTRCGAVYIYKIYEDSLSYFQKLFPPQRYPFAYFGWDIDVFENKMIIGAPNDSTIGAAHIFEFDGNFWVHNQKIIYQYSLQYSTFGQAVSIGENIICVGAPEMNSNGNNSGLVVFYKFENNEWVYKQTIVGSKVSAEHYFGGYLSLYQNRLAVSADGSIGAFNYSGAVYLFELRKNEWIEDNIISIDSVEDDHFGSSVIIREDTLIVGAAYQIGRGYFFIRNENEWKLQNIFTASDGHLNNAFAAFSSVDAGYIVFGASIQRTNGIQKGAVYIYTDKITSINYNVDKMLNFDLSQNYPNPFNPITKIKFSIPKSDIVQIKIYNILGKEVIKLINDYKPVGTYEVEFDARNLPSGVYFYRIISGSYSETKKMILLR